MSSSERTFDPVLTVRELASRATDGIHVRLLWDSREDGLTLVVAGARTGVVVGVPVERDRALDAFYHPFVYAGSAGADVLQSNAAAVAA